MHTLKIDTLRRVRNVSNCIGWGNTHAGPLPVECDLFFYVILLSQRSRVGEESPLTLLQLAAEPTHPFLLNLHIGKVTSVEVESGVWKSKAESVTGQRHRLIQHRQCRTELRPSMPDTPPWLVIDGDQRYEGYMIDTLLYQFYSYPNLHPKTQHVLGQVCDILGMSPSELQHSSAT